MNPDLAWPLVIVGICIVWIAVVALGDWLYRRRQYDPDCCGCWICSGTRAHREQVEQR